MKIMISTTAKIGAEHRAFDLTDEEKAHARQGGTVLFRFRKRSQKKEYAGNWYRVFCKNAAGGHDTLPPMELTRHSYTAVGASKSGVEAAGETWERI